MVLVWYPTGVRNDADAAIATLELVLGNARSIVVDLNPDGFGFPGGGDADVTADRTERTRVGYQVVQHLGQATLDACDNQWHITGVGALEVNLRLDLGCRLVDVYQCF